MSPSGACCVAGPVPERWGRRSPPVSEPGSPSRTTSRRTTGCGWAEPDRKVRFSLKPHIDRVVPDATGRVVARPDYGTPFPFDPKTKNNAAKVIVNPSSRTVKNNV